MIEDNERQPEQTFTPEELDNEDVVMQILVDGGETAVAQLIAKAGITREHFDFYRHFARLRESIHAEDTTALTARIAKNPYATREELDAGAYREIIESQVRDAVFSLREKGYPTYLSGFAGADARQTIMIAQPMFDEGELTKILAPIGDQFKVNITVTSKTIDFIPRETMSQDELTTVWNAIAATLPDRGSPAVPAEIGTAKIFRKKQTALIPRKT